MKVTLPQWAALQFREGAPHIKTLRRWCCEGKIFPVPQKLGRTYYVEENARYVGNFNDPEFMGRIRDAAQAQ
jgi:Excisionase-like protein